MNEFDDIEKELRTLRPARVSDRLMEAVTKELESLPTDAGSAEDKIIKPVWFRFGGLSLGAALAAAAAIFILARVDTTTVAPRETKTAAASPSAGSVTPVPMLFIPDGATRVVYHTQDEGLVFPRNATAPVRRVRSRTQETLQWRNPKTGESIRVTYPGEEVRLIPVSGQ